MLPIARGTEGELMCPLCSGSGIVCENHPERPWGGTSNAELACECGAGMPCPECCFPVPEDGTHSITEAFTPRPVT